MLQRKKRSQNPLWIKLDILGADFLIFPVSQVKCQFSFL